MILKIRSILSQLNTLNTSKVARCLCLSLNGHLLASPLTKCADGWHLEQTKLWRHPRSGLGLKIDQAAVGRHPIRIVPIVGSRLGGHLKGVNDIRSQLPTFAIFSLNELLMAPNFVVRLATPPLSWWKGRKKVPKIWSIIPQNMVENQTFYL